MVKSHFGYKVEYSKPFVADECEFSVSKASETVTHTSGEDSDVIVISAPKADITISGDTTAAFATSAYTVNYADARPDQTAFVQLGTYGGSGIPSLVASTAASSTREGLDVTVTVRNHPDTITDAESPSALDSPIPFSIVFV